MNTQQQKAVTGSGNAASEFPIRMSIERYNELRAIEELSAELLAVLKDGEFEVRTLLNCCDDKEIEDSFRGFDKFQKKARRIIRKAERSFAS